MDEYLNRKIKSCSRYHFFLTSNKVSYEDAEFWDVITVVW